MNFILTAALFTVLVSCSDSSELVLNSEDLKINQQSESVLTFQGLLILDDGKNEPQLLSDESKLRLFLDDRLQSNIRKFGEYTEFGIIRSIDNSTYIFAKFYSEKKDSYITSFFNIGNEQSMAPDIECENVHCCLVCVPQNNICVCHSIDIPCHRENDLLECRIVPK